MSASHQIFDFLFSTILKLERDQWSQIWILKALYDLLFSIFFTIHRDDKILSPEISFYLLEIVLYDYYKCAAHNYVTYPKKAHFLWSFNRLLVAKWSCIIVDLIM